MIPFKDNITLVNDQLIMTHEVCKSVKQGTVLCTYSSISVLHAPKVDVVFEWYCINKLEEYPYIKKFVNLILEYIIVY